MLNLSMRECASLQLALGVGPPDHASPDLAVDADDGAVRGNVFKSQTTKFADAKARGDHQAQCCLEVRFVASLRRYGPQERKHFRSCEGARKPLATASYGRQLTKGSCCRPISV